MQPLDPEFIERYQRLYDQDPKSQIFALLADAYRKVGKVLQAMAIIKEGLKYHPQMASAHLVLGRIYLDSNEVQKSLGPLQEATKLAPENILAHQYLAEAFLKLKRPKEALNAYKLIMLINPTDPLANKAIKKLESLTADEYSADLFATIHPTGRSKPSVDLPPQATAPISSPKLTLGTTLERTLSLADALAARNDIEKAIKVLETGREELGAKPEIINRLKMLASLSEDITISSPPPPSPELNQPERRDIANSSKTELLNKLLKRIQTRRRDLER